MPQGKVPSTSRSIPGALEEGCSFQGLGEQGVPGTSPSGWWWPHHWKVLSWQVKKLQDETSVLPSISENEQENNRLFAETLQRGVQIPRRTEEGSARGYA